MEKYYLGVDVGSVSTNLVLLNEDEEVIKKLYIRTLGRPADKIKEGLKFLRENTEGRFIIAGAGATGSGRALAAVLLGADIVKNEITAHAVAALKYSPDVRTVFEIGGQDSKIIFLRDGVVTDFAMNTVCAAGTGSFLDRQAARLGIPIEEFGSYALKSKNPVKIAGRCAVFAESDMIHKQQCGHSAEDIIAGLSSALVRNYLNNLAKGKSIEAPIVFQGGVAANVGIVAAFERELNEKLLVPPHYEVMGAIGAALLSKEANLPKSNFKGFGLVEADFLTKNFECDGCPNRCEVVEIRENSAVIARWGDRCGKWTKIGSKIEAGSREQKGVAYAPDLN
jgi:CoA-substrate-specific enzyme activase, putative